jgi:hypothetical protein
VTAGASTSETLLIALAGGAIGVLLTGLAWLLLKVASIPGDLQRHDFETRIVNEDLKLWAADEYRRVKRELTAAETRLANRGQLYTGTYGNARSAIKTAALHRWRDRLHAAERKIVAIRSREHRLHDMARKRKKYKYGLDLTAPTQVEPIINEFRQPITKHGQDRLKVFDPTKFELDDLLRAIEDNPLEPPIPPEVEDISDGAGGWSKEIRHEPPPETPDIPGLSGPIEPPPRQDPA